MGTPGAGKGTQGNWISSFLNIPKVSSGDLFRQHQNNQTELGQLASTYMQKGKLVPDKITVAMVMEWIENNKHSEGFVLDGYPRTLPQAQALDISLINDGFPVSNGPTKVKLISFLFSLTIFAHSINVCMPFSSIIRPIKVIRF